MEMFKPKFFLNIKISSSGKSQTLKAEAMVKKIIMVIYKV